MSLCELPLALGETEYRVGIADWKVVSSKGRLVTLGLGSCVAVVMYDVGARIGGMVHIMLPDSSQFSEMTNPAKFADTGVSLLFEETLAAGARRRGLTARMAGGANMFTSTGQHALLRIGQRNVAACNCALERLGLTLTGTDVGGHRGRSVFFDIGTGRVLVRTSGQPVMEI